MKKATEIVNQIIGWTAIIGGTMIGGMIGEKLGYKVFAWWADFTS